MKGLHKHSDLQYRVGDEKVRATWYSVVIMRLNEMAMAGYKMEDERCDNDEYETLFQETGHSPPRLKK